MLIDFCAENKLYIANTHFQHHPRRLWTWRSPDGRTKNQIDYILVNTRWKTSIKDVKTYPGKDCGSDHNVLIAEISLKLRKPHITKPIVNRWGLRNDVTYIQQSRRAIHEITPEHREKANAEELWHTMKERMEEAATKGVIQKKAPHKPWISQHTRILINERKELKSAGIDDVNKLDSYNEKTKTINKALHSDKNEYLSSICKEIEAHKHHNEPRDLFRKVKLISRSFKPQYLPIEDEAGSLLTEMTDILQRWRQYCQDLMSDNNETIPETTLTTDNIFEREPPIIRSEIEAAMQRLANNKSAGSDGIVAEMIKATGEPGITTLLAICNKIWESCNWPNDWTQSIYIPLHKKGSKQHCANYRTIALISHPSKIMLYIIQERLKPYLLPNIPPEQAGFVPGRGTRDQIINVRQMIEKFYEFNVPAMLCFLDYSKAFDNVNWNHLWRVLQEMAVPYHLIQLIKTLYTNNKAYIRVDGRLSESFKIEKGVRQGCVLSPLLFNIYGEWIIRKATEDWEGGVLIGGRKISNLRYADDTTLLANDEEEMTMLLQRIKTFSEEAGLKLNVPKCCLMIVDRRNVIPRPLQHIPDIQLKDEVIYLGVSISNVGGCENEIKRRFGMAKSALASLTKIWKDHHISKETKKRLVQTLIFPIATYGSESWTVNAAGRRRIEAFEMTCYRRMLRIPWTARKTNASILQELNINSKTRLLPSIQQQILKFFGHIIRRDGFEKLMIQGKVEGKRQRGRSPNRYLDQIKTLANLPLEDIMHSVEDRETWRNITTN